MIHSWSRTGGASRLLLLLTIAAFVIWPFACVLDPVDYTGKTCPCPAPWRCVSNVCVADGAGGACTPLIVPTNLRGEWATSNAIRWAWDVNADAGVDQFGSYTLNLVSDAGVMSFTAVQNPELGQFNLPNTEGISPVTSTITDGLLPDVVYLGQLVAVDNAGCPHATEVVPYPTSIHWSGQVPLFENMLPPGGGMTDPAGTVLASSCPSGTPCIAYTNDCSMQMTATCYQVFRLDFSLSGSDIATMMTLGEFARAYLEMDVATNSSLPAYWSEFRLRTDGFYSVGGLTVRNDGAFRTYQIPLRAMENTALAQLTYQDLTDAGVYEFGVGGSIDDKKQVWIANVSLKW